MCICFCERVCCGPIVKHVTRPLCKQMSCYCMSGRSVLNRFQITWQQEHSSEATSYFLFATDASGWPQKIVWNGVTRESALLKACEKYPCPVSDIWAVQLWHSWQHFFSSLSSLCFCAPPPPHNFPALLSLSQASGQHIPELGAEGQEPSLTSVYAKIQPHPSKATGKDHTVTGSGVTVLDHLWKFFHCFIFIQIVSTYMPDISKSILFEEKWGLQCTGPCSEEAKNRPNCYCLVYSTFWSISCRCHIQHIILLYNTTWTELNVNYLFGQRQHTGS